MNTEMYYDVQVCYGDHNTWRTDIKRYNNALSYAMEMSLEAGVSETHIFFAGELVDTVVDGNVVEPIEETWVDNEPSGLWDEVGYNPYIGGYDFDC